MSFNCKLCGLALDSQRLLEFHKTLVHEPQNCQESTPPLDQEKCYLKVIVKALLNCPAKAFVCDICDEDVNMHLPFAPGNWNDHKETGTHRSKKAA